MACMVKEKKKSEKVNNINIFMIFFGARIESC
jgi:hypothetical protein